MQQMYNIILFIFQENKTQATFLYLLPQRNYSIRYFINFSEKLFVEVEFFLVLVLSLLYNFYYLLFRGLKLLYPVLLNIYTLI
jgi:hypothetical protein